MHRACVTRYGERGTVILVTGANGFVGSALLPVLQGKGFRVRAAVRAMPAPRTDWVTVGNIGPATEWAAALKGVDAVVHLAGRAHVMRERGGDPLAAYREVNVAGTERLAWAAAAEGVRRIVYLSTVKVHGEETYGRPFREDDMPAPRDPYAQSKHEAELALFKVARATGLEIVIVRPTLVYGPGVKGNVLRLLTWVDRGLPLPFALSRNRRSMVSVGNLVDLVRNCLASQAVTGRVLLAADGADLSTGSLVRRLGRAMGRRPRLFPVPPGLARSVCSLAGRPGLGARLFGSLQVDTTRARELLGWCPPQSVDEGLVETARWYLRGSDHT